MTTNKPDCEIMIHVAVGARDDDLAVGADGDTPHWGFVPLQIVPALARLEVPRPVAYGTGCNSVGSRVQVLGRCVQLPTPIPTLACTNTW